MENAMDVNRTLLFFDLISKCKKCGYEKITIQKKNEHAPEILVHPSRATIDHPWEDIWRIIEGIELGSFGAGSDRRKQISKELYDLLPHGEFDISGIGVNRYNK